MGGSTPAGTWSACHSAVGVGKVPGQAWIDLATRPRPHGRWYIYFVQMHDFHSSTHGMAWEMRLYNAW